MFAAYLTIIVVALMCVALTGVIFSGILKNDQEELKQVNKQYGSLLEVKVDKKAA